MIDGRDRTKLDGLDRQVAAVRDALATPAHPPPLHGVLCVTKADLPLLGATSMHSHLLLTRKGLAKRLNAGGPLSWPAIDETARTPAQRFPRRNGPVAPIAQGETQGRYAADRWSRSMRAWRRR